jgi:hypothetical protein
MTTPVTVIDGEVVVGFAAPKLPSLLQISQSARIVKAKDSLMTSPQIGSQFACRNTFMPTNVIREISSTWLDTQESSPHTRFCRESGKFAGDRRPASIYKIAHAINGC